MTAGVDINAFPPELPPNPDTDDIGGDELDHAQAGEHEWQEGDPVPENPPVILTGNAPAGKVCDYCGGPAALGIYYLADGAKEWACYPCHATVIAQALNAAADEAEAGGS